MKATSRFSATRFSTIEPLESRIAPAVLIVNSVLDVTSTPAGTLTLPEALASAHSGDTIKFHLKAATSTAEENVILLTTPLPTITGDLTISGPGPGKLIISGEDARQVFNITGSGVATISGLSIVNGKATYGGGISSNESLTLKNVIISGNAATSAGGGVYVNGRSASSPVNVKVSNSLITGNSATLDEGGLGFYDLNSLAVSNTVVTGNRSEFEGGGLYASLVNPSGTIKISHSQFTDNTAGTGGGLFLNGDGTGKVTISSTKITGNISYKTTIYEGGGLYSAAGNLLITGSTIRNNTAVYDGGGVEVRGGGPVTISNSSITGNVTTKTSATGQGGGGVFIMGTGSSTPEPVKITGSQINDNHSAFAGGGLYVFDGVSATISGSTFAGNSAEDGGGLTASGSGTDAANLSVSGSVFSDNTVIPITGLFFGGGIDTAGTGTISITGTKVSGNFAPIGGGIFVDNSGSGAVSIKNVNASHNSAIDGGGMEIAGGVDFAVKGGSFTGNVAVSGGGIYASNSSGSILGATISGNVATVIAGGAIDGGGAPGNIALQFAKVFANSSTLDPDWAGPFTAGV